MSNNLTIQEAKLLQQAEDELGRNGFRELTASERASLKTAARTTLKKNKTITLRINEDILLMAKAKARSLGIPYQTWITSLVKQNL